MTQLESQSPFYTKSSTSADNCNDFWRDKLYPTRHIPNLPRDIRFSDTVTLSLNYARKADVTSSLYDVVHEAAGRGDNVGVDEYDLERLLETVEFAEIFIARWSTSSGLVTPDGAIAAFLVIRPSDFVRTIDPCLADLRVFRSRDVPDSVYFKLIELAVELTTDLDCGYTDCVLAVSSTCRSLLRDLIGRQQFEPIVTIPRTVNMVSALGLVDSILLHKNLNEKVRPPRSLEEVLSTLARHGIKDGAEDDEAYSKLTLRTSPALPRRLVLGKNQLPVVIRNMRKDEDRIAFRIISETVSKGEGYPLHSYPNLAWFRRCVMASTRCAVLDYNTEVIGWFALGRSPLSRCLASNTSSGLLVLDKNYQGQGIGKSLQDQSDIAYSIYGFKIDIAQVVANNTRQQKNMAKSNSERIGTIPRAGWIVGSEQWVDRDIFYTQFQGMPATISTDTFETDDESTSLASVTAKL